MAESTYSVERTSRIPAAPTVVHDLVADFRQWSRWSPWEDLDPDLQRTYSGAERGTGAVYEWSGNKKAGEGRMEITSDTAPGPGDTPGEVVIDLQFLKPFKSRNVTTFTLTPVGEETDVRWHMRGPRPLLMRLFSFLMDPEKFVGKDFEKGLARMQAAAANR